MQIIKNRFISAMQSGLMKTGLYRPKDVWYSYISRDYHVVDYQPYKIGNLPYDFRGPRPDLKENNDVAFTGAAQTFGTLSREPFPDLIKNQLNVDVLSLGTGGAGPRHFLHEELLSEINKSRVAVIQVLSARSVENSVLKDCTGIVTVRETGEKLSSNEAYSRILQQPGDYGERIIEETRQNYIQLYKELLTKIRVPKILFWFSDREPDYKDDYSSVKGIFHRFPQMVNREMTETIADLCDDYVECVTDRGLPNQLTSRFNGKGVSIIDGPGRKPKTKNYYYPSPQMHEDTARSLLPALEKYL